MVLDFIERHPMQRTDDDLRLYINGSDDLRLYINGSIDKLGYIVDRLKPIAVERYGKACWKYAIPVIQVVR
jgi:hypothetical protein